MNTSLFELVEFTQRSIFLTGRAGTGKTTFLNNFVKNTHKKYIIVAPTGIAAINAGGVTIHSMFGLPLRTFLPTVERIDGNIAMNIADLKAHFKYRKDKIKLLREVEIIVIDEVSMLRADVLDMMDFSLRHIRRNQLPFGGVQMLFIGDLYQLPPVVRDENILRTYYESPFFFDAHAIKNVPLITVKLTEVYRQKDPEFLEILNAIREGNIDQVDFDKLNARYIPDFDPADEAYVYLTSHNRMAYDINQAELNKLGGPLYKYKASIHGDFKENQFPNDEELELKLGAQVMFIRNDASGEKKYYNGKLAEVVHLSDEEIVVRIEGSDEDYRLKKEVWEHKIYVLDEEKNIQEEVLGSFEQYPIKLAWAVTIHKSQGLTFDRLIIDAGKSFASGQVYVALSRCRTLEGIVLKSKILPHVVFSDSRVENFQIQTHANEKIEDIIKTEKFDFAIKKVLRLVDCLWMIYELEKWYETALGSKVLDKEKVESIYPAMKFDVINLGEIYKKLDRILNQKIIKFGQNLESWQAIEDKAKGAVNFFFTEVNSKIFAPLKSFYGETKGVKGLKQFNEEFRLLLEDLEDYLKHLQNLYLLDVKLLDEDKNVEVSQKVAKVPTQKLTFELFQQGLTPLEIAKERNITLSTVFGHLDKYAGQGELEIERLIASDKIQNFEEKFEKNKEVQLLKEWKELLPDGFEYHEIRLLLSYYNWLESSKEDNYDEAL